MPRKSRRDRELQEIFAELAAADREYEVQWRARRRIQLDPAARWRRVGSDAVNSVIGDLVHSLADGGLVVLMDGPAGWFIADTKARTFEVCENPLPPGARRHGRRVYFQDEESARLAADTLPGYWWDAGEPNR